MESNNGPKRPGTPSPAKEERMGWVDWGYDLVSGGKLSKLKSSHEDLRAKSDQQTKHIEQQSKQLSEFEHQKKRDDTASSISQGGAIVGGAATGVQQTMTQMRKPGRPTKLNQNFVKSAKTIGTIAPMVDVASGVYKQDYVDAALSGVQALSLMAINMPKKAMPKRMSLFTNVAATATYGLASLLRFKKPSQGGGTSGNQ